MAESISTGISISNDSHQIKKVNFNGCRYIVTQKERSQPALLSLANALILRSSLQLPSNQTTLSKLELLAHISDLLLSAPPTEDVNTSEDHEFKLNAALNFLGDEPWEMAVNPKFAGVDQFSPTPGLDVFKMLRVRLFHTHLVDPNFTFLSSMIDGLSLGELHDKIVMFKASGDHSKIDQAEAALDVLSDNQMYGDTKLAENVDEEEIGVLFRNGNFSTIYKKNGVIYQLVTDEKYLMREDIVWEIMDATEEFRKFVDQHWEDVKDSSNHGQSLVVKICPQGHCLRFKVTSIHPNLTDWKCNVCDGNYFGSDICYDCDHWDHCNYQICGGCYFMGREEIGKTDEVGGSAILLQKICPQGHKLVWDQGVKKPFDWRCDCCDKDFKGEAAENISFQCSYPGECKYTVCGNCFYDEHDNSCGVKKQVRCPPWLKEGKALSIIVTEVVSPAKFWFQLQGWKTSRALDKLMQDMEYCYRWDDENEGQYRLSGNNPREECKPGAIMAAPYECEGYHRVRINKIFKNNNVEVFYVDYGTISEVPLSKIRILPTRFRSLSSQAIEGKLWGVIPPGIEKTWPSKSCGRFLDLVSGIGESSGSYSNVKRIQTDSRISILHLEVYAPEGKCEDKTLSINQLLVCEGLAEVESSSVFSANSPKCATGQDETKELSIIQGETDVYQNATFGKPKQGTNISKCGQNFQLFNILKNDIYNLDQS